MALIALKVINFLAFLAKHENNFDVPGVACGAPTTPNLLHSLAHHTTRFMRAAPYRGGQPRARKRKASIGKNKISAVIYLPTPLVGSGWCLEAKSPPLAQEKQDCRGQRDCYAERAAASKTQKSLPAHPRGPDHTALEEQPLLSSFGQPRLATNTAVSPPLDSPPRAGRHA